MQSLSYGSWPSPLSATLLVEAAPGFGAVHVHGSTVCWSESRAKDAGRVVVVAKEGDADPVDMFAAPFSARTRVHEYGGGSWWCGQSHLFFCNWDDQCVYRLSYKRVGIKTALPSLLTLPPQTPQSVRYADGEESPCGKWFVCVRESHHDTATEARNDIVLIPTDGSAANGDIQVSVVATGADFYSTPRISPNGKYISWIQWNHPQMPWDGTELWVAQIHTDNTVAAPLKIAGATDVSINGALWSSDNRLLYASDHTGWWNLYQIDPDEGGTTSLTSFKDADIGVPPWAFNVKRFVELSSVVETDSSTRAAAKNAQQKLAAPIAIVLTRDAGDHLVVIDKDAQQHAIETNFVSMGGIAASSDGGVVTVGQYSDALSAVVQLSPQAKNTEADNTSLEALERAWTIRALSTSNALPIDKQWLSKPEAITFTSDDYQSHAFFYPPATALYTGEANELPPLLVMGHGGPTGHSTAAFRLGIQFWTSRGIAVVDVNYAGSSGFGRDYRRLLKKRWGERDVQDCIAAARYLAEAGRVDAKRMVIRGGSAGGLTVLRALQTSDQFATGTSLYGVTDLAALAGDTHKFESRYIDGLVGEYPKDKAIYDQRSPINHPDKLNCPLLVLQGDEDKIVPPSQSAAIIDAVAKKNLPHAYVLFEGEQHGFRKAENIVRAMEIELWFYSKVLGFDTADQLTAPEEAVGF